MTYLQPGILWGQHRSTELIAISVKDLLAKDLQIKIPFIEYKEWQKSDYVSVLYQLRQADNQGLNWNESGKQLGNQATKYEQQLVNNYGQFLLNFHDGHKDAQNNQDIEFWITRFINEQDSLEEYLLEKAKKHSLEIHTRKFKKGLIQVNNNFITVEFMTPEEIPINYETNEIKTLDNKYGDGHEWYTAKKQDTKNQLFKETVNKYARYMKDVLKDINEIKLTIRK